MIHPLLDGSLHAHLHQPIYIVGRGLVVRRLRHELVDLLLSVPLRDVKAVYLHPLQKFPMVDDVFFEAVAHLVYIVHMHIGVVRIHLAATLVDRHEYRLYARGGLAHERRGARGGNRQAGDISATIFLHVGIQLGVGLLQAQDERIVSLALCIIDGKGTSLPSHCYRGAIGVQGQFLMNRHGEIGRLLRAIAQTQGCNHVALGRNAYARAASLAALILDFLPQMILRLLHARVLGIYLNLLHDHLYLLHFQIDDIIHHPLGKLNMLPELVEVEIGILGEGVYHIAIEVQTDQSAAIVGAERNLTTGVRADGAEAQIGIAIGYALSDDGIPEEDTWLRALPSVVHNLLPKVLGRDLLPHLGILRIHRELLGIGSSFRSCAHKLVIHLHAHVGSGDLSLGHLCIDERLAVGMLDTHREHEGAATAVLSHLAGRVAIAFHEGYQPRRRQRRVIHGASGRTDVGQIVPHAAATLHQLHLFLIDLHDGAIRIGIPFEAYHEAIAQRGNLEVVANARHRAAGRDHIAEVVDQFEYLLSAQRVFILLLNASNLVGNTPVHILRRPLVDIAKTVLHGILVRPNSGRQLVAIKVLQGCLIGLLERIGL